jgi:hypothetical protein
MTKSNNKKKANRKLETVLIDFDGVISRNSVLNNFKTAHQFINQYIPIPFEALFCFLKSTTAFSMQHTLTFLLSSLGITGITELQQQALINDLYINNSTIKIEEEFYHFLDFCDINSIRYIIFSSAGKSINEISELVNRIGSNSVYDLNGRSKVNSKTYHEAAKELGFSLKKCMYIDDTPLALQIGKLQGIITVMMLNDVFTNDDYKIFESFIDYKINSFSSLEGIIQKFI